MGFVFRRHPYLSCCTIKPFNSIVETRWISGGVYFGKSYPTWKIPERELLNKLLNGFEKQLLRKNLANIKQKKIPLDEFPVTLFGHHKKNVPSKKKLSEHCKDS